MVSGGASSGRRRLGVALLLDPPHAAEVDGLRRAVGDRSLGRVPPHLTLVPPVNVRGRDLTAALGRLRAAAAAGGRPLRLTLGPPTSFLPANPVLYLPVGGDLPELRRVHDTVFAGPLERPLAWPWVPHVTLADDATPERIAAAVDALTGYQVVVDVDRLTMLEERSAAFAPGERGNVRRWVPYADAALAPPVVVGRGGLEVTLVPGRVLGPDARRLVDELGELGDDGSGEGPADIEPEIVLTALAGTSGARAGAGGSGDAGSADAGSADAGSTDAGVDRAGPDKPVGLEPAAGVACAWRADDGAHVAVLVAPAWQGVGIGRHLLGHLEDAVRRAGWDAPVLQATGPAGFYAACSRWSVAAT